MLQLTGQWRADLDLLHAGRRDSAGQLLVDHIVVLTDNLPGLRVDAETIGAFGQAVQGWTEVIACFAMTGEMDFLLHVYFEDLEHFSRFVLNNLLTHPGVSEVKSSFVLQEIKQTTALPLSHLSLTR